MAKSQDTPLQDILNGIKNGDICLPEFQRGWVWDDERIRGLIASIICSYPVGAVMLLEYGGDTIRFKSRTFTNVIDDGKVPEKLVLDGQQRLTSVYCAMHNKKPVPTQTIKKEKIQRYYYLNILKCLDQEVDRIDAVVSVPTDKMIKRDFGRIVVTDLSDRDGEFREHMFPLNIVYNTAEANVWKNGYRKFHKYDEEIISKLDKFDELILNPILQYTIPVILLEKSTPKEAVCQMFENVNTGGVPLTVFELVTATFAADDFPLRKDWDTRANKMKYAEGTFELLNVVSATDFLTAMTMLAQIKNKKTLSCKRKDVLSLSVDDYKSYADSLTDGFIKSARFLVQQSILAPRDLPYTTQFVPLSVIMTLLGTKSDDSLVNVKLANWYWCGVFGEMYGSSNETRYVNDVQKFLSWLDGGEEPDTVSRAFFHPTRLLSLQTRNGAAYKGVMSLILKDGAKDFITGNKMDFTNFIADSVDIHHIFPQNYCERQEYEKRKWNCIVNKTPIAYRTNRKIGGDAPGQYLIAIEKNVAEDMLNDNVKSHNIDVLALRDNNFDEFFISRAKSLLKLISSAMGKQLNNLDSPDVIEAFGESLEIATDDNAV